MEKLNIWVVCKYFSEDSYKEICSEDLERFLKIYPYQRVLQCVGRDDEFMYLKCDEEIFRVRESLLKSIEEATFKIGEIVNLINKKEKAVVVSISWHYKQKEPIYIVKVNDKIKKTRYFAKDMSEI